MKQNALKAEDEIKSLKANLFDLNPERSRISQE
jgi:hypothetical protein